MKQLVFLCLLVVMMSTGSYAQRVYGLISYDLSYPLSSTGDFVDNNMSARGGGIEFGGFINDRVSIGIGASWNVFYKNVGRVTFTDNSTTITGKQFRYFNAVPIYGMARYFFRLVEQQSLLPFVGFGTGALYGRQRIDVGLFSGSFRGWQFGLFPEAGLQYKLRSGVGVVLSGRYNHGFENDNLPTTSFIGVNLGLTLPLR
jgi:opacity protein-like surface antigen